MVQEICRQYLDALNEGSLEKILSLFDQDAVVVSPLYGEMSAARFYKDLFADTGRSETRLLNIFHSVSGTPDLALHFHYLWTLKNGKTVEFECVDVFEISWDSNRIKRLKIIYDTAAIRADFHENQS
ncbi:MAG TPA: nuclear transport factor 2 family protein [Desulfobacteraceae bacterium]|jgi:ketosteroid isomerase-like protein|nr:nuclear transport factor 2 family protein [Desulfobacteraceae bacterium]HPJ67912.1 nuclear transport factor 2 family protein [Desulfobacteraceae bacterium]HPQ28826.1 nuclear transport factor 2 family protein [Desulfobacteraceae bacterium]